MIQKYDLDNQNIKESELFQKKLFNKSKGILKLLNKGSIDIPINIEISMASKKAVEKLEKAGGKIKILKK